MAESIVLRQSPAPRIVIAQSVQNTASMHPAPIEIEVEGSPEPGASYIIGTMTPEQADLSGAAFFIQTGLGPDGEDFTIWIEDEE